MAKGPLALLTLLRAVHALCRQSNFGFACIALALLLLCSLNFAVSTAAASILSCSSVNSVLAIPATLGLAQAFAPQ